MYAGKKIIGIIPARGGSKGLPKKNILPLAGKPLIGWAIEEAKKSRFIDYLILSSEDKEIIDIAKSFGCSVPFLRPAELSKDDTHAIAPVLHALKMLTERYDYIVLLQPTSPLRKVSDIDGCVEFCINQNAKSCISVVEPTKNPYWMFSLGSDNRLSPLIPQKKRPDRRQDLPKIYVPNGAIYVAEIEWLFKNNSFITNETIAYIMPQERSIDIDNIIDFKMAEILLKENIVNV